MKHCCKELFEDLEEERVGLSAPEFSFYHKVRAFFEGDPDFDVSDIEDYTFTITVHDIQKYNILKKALTVPKQARRLVMFIDCDVEETEEVSEKDLGTLLESNPYFDSVNTEEDTNGLLPLMRFVLMKPEIIQYYNDRFENPWGVETKTAEQVARELFRGKHCNITTAVDDDPCVF